MPAGVDEWQRYVSAMNNASLLAQNELWELAPALDGLPPEQQRDALIEAYQAIADKYAGIAALAAGDYYAAVRLAQIGVDEEPMMPEPPDAERMEGSVRFAAKYLFGGADG